jgi:glycogen debranching enzyme
LLLPLIDHLADGCIGTISEIFDGDPPHHPRGCFAQAWSVAEVLRVWYDFSTHRSVVE